MNVDADVLMEDASMLVRGLSETKFHKLSNVRIIERAPSLEHSLPNTLEFKHHPNFQGMDYPLLIAIVAIS